MLQSRPLGTTDVTVSHISFGCASIANLYARVTDKAAQDVLSYAWQRGIRYFDTAPHYGRGLSETRLGQFLQTVPKNEVTLSSKVGRVLTPGKQRSEADGFVSPLPNDVRYDYSGAGIMESFEGSLERLGVDHLDIVYVHDIGKLTHGADNDRHMEDLLSTGLPALERLKVAGKIGAYGLGVNECEVCVDVMKHHTLDVILLAGRWTLLDRSAEKELIPLCQQANTSLVLGGIFNSGILATGAKEGAHFDYAPASEEILAKTRALEQECLRDGIPLATAAMQFGLSKDIVASVLLGTGKVSSLARNLDALKL
ncbi:MULTISPECIES: aldo/keto reductase [Falsihalocynthiibacter]